MGTMSLAGLGGLAVPPLTRMAPSPPRTIQWPSSRASAAPAGHRRHPRAGPLRRRRRATPTSPRRSARKRSARCSTGSAAPSAVRVTRRSTSRIAALAPFSGPAQASVLGRRERLDMLHAALMNGISSHVFDFDDTHLKTVIHPGRPGRVGAAGAGRVPPDVGRRLPARDGARHRGRVPHRQRRVSGALRPRLAHHRHRRRLRRGGGVRQGARASPSSRWCGRSGSRPRSRSACARCSASMTKSFHPGRAAQNGLTAALLARAQLHQHRGRHRGQERLGQRAQHHARLHRDHRQPRRDATRSRSTPTSRSPAASSSTRPSTPASSCATSTRCTADDIERIDLGVHPLVLELTGKKTPQTGLESKFSVYFAAALAIVRGSAGMRDFSDANATRPGDRRACATV